MRCAISAHAIGLRPVHHRAGAGAIPEARPVGFPPMTRIAVGVVPSILILRNDRRAHVRKFGKRSPCVYSGALPISVGFYATDRSALLTRWPSPGRTDTIIFDTRMGNLLHWINLPPGRHPPRHPSKPGTTEIADRRRNTNMTPPRKRRPSGRTQIRNRGEGAYNITLGARLNCAPASRARVSDIERFLGDGGAPRRPPNPRCPRMRAHSAAHRLTSHAVR